MTPRRPARWSSGVLAGVLRGLLFTWVALLVAWPSHHPSPAKAQRRFVSVFLSAPPAFDWRWDLAQTHWPSSERPFAELGRSP